jgi:putative transposase
MGDKRRKFTAAFKTQVALETLKGLKPINEIASQHGVHPNQVSTWKKQAQEGLPALFEDGRCRQHQAEQEDLVARLYQQIGQLKVELDWLKKKSGLEP